MTVNYARRQQWRRLRTAASRAAGAAVALTAAVLAASADEAELGLLLVLLSGGLALASRHALRLAARSRVGAESEVEVRRTLERLEHSGWSVRHAVDWPGLGDLDHVVRSPSELGFVIETKTLRYTHANLVRAANSARWLARRARRYPCGVRPVICLARARRVERMERDVLVVSLDRLLAALCQTAGTDPRRAELLRGARELRRLTGGSTPRRDDQHAQHHTSAASSRLATLRGARPVVRRTRSASPAAFAMSGDRA